MALSLTLDLLLKPPTHGTYFLLRGRPLYLWGLAILMVIHGQIYFTTPSMRRLFIIRNYQVI